MSEEFQQLAIQFTNASLFEYAGLCYLGASKCEKAQNNQLSEVHFLLKSARSFVKATEEVGKLHLRSDGGEYLDGALSCYNLALAQMDDDSVMKAAIIREMKKLQPNCELTSNFVSPAHRVRDLEIAALECIRTEDNVGALEKLTEIHDDITERNMHSLYEDLLKEGEITRTLLLLQLQLPPSRQSPSNIKLLEKFLGWRDVSETTFLHTDFVMDSMESLIFACQFEKEPSSIFAQIASIASIPGVTQTQQILLQQLQRKYER